MDGGRLRLRLAAYALLAAVLDEAKEDVEIRFDARAARRSSCASIESTFIPFEKDDGASGIADREETVTLGLGGDREDVEDDGEGETEVRDERLLGISGRALSGASEFGGGIRLPTAAR